MAYPTDFINFVFPQYSQTSLLENNTITCVCLKIEGLGNTEAQASEIQNAELKSFANENAELDWLAILPPFTTSNEQKNAEKFLLKKDAIRHLLGRALLRKTLGIDVVDFSYTKFGKPYLPNSPISFNLSHSGSMVCLALCPCARLGSDVNTEIKINIGIDIEEIRPIDTLLNQDMSNPIFQLHEKEIESFQPYMDATNNEDESSLLHAFYRCWTRKEATAKACGLGLELELNSYQVDIEKKEKNWIIQYPQNLLNRNDLHIPHAPTHHRTTHTLAHDTASYNMDLRNIPLQSHVPDNTAPHTCAWTSYDLNINKNYACSVVALFPELRMHIINI